MEVADSSERVKRSGSTSRSRRMGLVKRATGVAYLSLLAIRGDSSVTASEVRGVSA